MSLYANTTQDNTASPYMPLRAVVLRVTRMTEKERLFRLSPEGGVPSYGPGQFFMAGLPGYGEAPFSVTSRATPDAFELCVRAAGNLTNAIHRLKKGDSIWLRGPFGRGFDVPALRGRDILFIAGGIGMVPMRALVEAVLAERSSFGRLTLVYGSKTPEEILFTSEMEAWKSKGLQLHLTIDKPFPGWKGRAGVVTAVIPGLGLDPSKTSAVVVGPPVMYKFVIMSLWDKKIPREEIILSLERRMKCGLGKCGHCQINSSYVCQEGPVYRLSELNALGEAFL
ncbi:MAG: FAD/NAD(P)-binding protein [Deltaproteobacteria bacterium]|nr:FAD/NAD(P)-binding protein [Deltaproteobacteria bacterium]